MNTPAVPPAVPAGIFGALKSLLRAPLTLLLVALPIAVGLEWSHAPKGWVFLFSCIAVIPLAGLMGRATENLAETMGAGVGGLLNATFGNAAELIIALVILANARGQSPEKQEEMLDLVKASLTGSIIGNILLVLGLSILLGGLRYPRQTFNRTGASMTATLMALASIGLIIPTIFFYLMRFGQGILVIEEKDIRTVDHLSEEIAGILGFIYLISLVFSLRTHSHLFEEDNPLTLGEHQHSPPEWNRLASITILVLATAAVAWMSELLVHSVETAAEAMGMTKVFIGVIVVAVIGNAAEHSTAVMMAMKNKMDLALNVAVGSSIQIALFVAPVLVFASLGMGLHQPLDLHFTPMELIAILLSVGVLALVSLDGETHWMEGVMLLAVYVMLGLAFYHLPKVRW